MFHTKNKISAVIGIALVVFLASCATLANKGDSSAASAQEQVASNADAATTAPSEATTAPSEATTAPSEATAAASEAIAAPSAVATAPNASQSQASNQGKFVIPVPAKTVLDDSPEAIKERSGPGDPIAGKEKSELCQGCHGEAGVSVEGLAPKLAGQYGIYIAKELRNFQAGTRTHQIMSAIAATISDDDLADIAAYFASRKKMKGDGNDNKLGKELFLHGDMTRMMVACVNCHGANGKGKTPTNPVFPVIGGQHKDYLMGQLTNFRAGDRTNSPGGVMNIITQKLTDKELEALADYVSGL